MEELTGVNASLGVEATETQAQLTKVVEMRVEAEIQAADIERGALAVRLCCCFSVLDGNREHCVFGCMFMMLTNSQFPAITSDFSIHSYISCLINLIVCHYDSYYHAFSHFLL